MKVKRDQITGAVLVVLGIVVIGLISQFSKPITAEYPGPRLMPGIAALGLVICGLGTFVNGCRQKEADAIILTKEGMIRVIITFAALWVYILGLQYLGFLIVTPVLVYGLTTYFAKASNAETKLWVRIVFALAVTFVIWFMYVQLFGMELPVGSLFE
ncbi:MAG: tripartite tricarboxylate transporter TctB family protein [Clostridia bacterium]|nr:tripartite tricarboxylate transporter TctB family protein [Clostridia bacterium]